MTPHPRALAAIQSASANGINIHYEQTGSGPHLVLIHGLTGSLADWNLRLVPLLSGKFTTLTYDLRGHGYSDMPPSSYTSADMASDLLGLLDALKIERAHIVGHSLGGAVALHFAALYPQRVWSLTISDSRIRSLQPSQKIKDWTHWPLWREQLEKQGLTLDEEGELDFALLQLLFAQRSAQRQSGTTASERRRQEWWAQFLASTTANVDLRNPAGLTPELISQIRIPIQAVYGEYSFCLPSLSALTQCLQGLKSTILPGVGHFYPIFRPESLVELIKAFHGPHANG